ncbi:helix-turn-helix domain-containing protein [Streptomyces sp. CMB-StM0423]|uniref:helix-turn-helix domain-containing protein n=1 Tax=Streptomyces sp. CMB-StM0423 TaxID=2059884 RepID=UPI000C715637|nr:helix-turn-helix transcriptional regulator [Streptomyces sp. CMB-StM0423]AUH41415.1 LuxR family transcriptional regulator [Streptomyces sp. CMB-StM0423]
MPTPAVLTPAARGAVRGELLARADRAPDALALFAEVSAQLRRLLPYDAAVWRTTDPATGLMTAPVRTENTDKRGCWDYWECELFDERVNRFADLARARVPVAALRASTGGEPERAAIYRQFLRPRGLHDELRAVLRVGGRPQGHLSLFRSRGRAPFSAAEERVVAGLTTPLARRLRSYAEPAAGRADQGAEESVRNGEFRGGRVGRDEPGLLLFDAGARLVSANTAARRHLAALPPGPTRETALGLAVPAWLHGVVLQARAATAAESATADSAAGTPAPADTADRPPAATAAAPRVRLRTAAGRWLTCHASCLHGADGTPQSTAVVIEPAAAAEIAPLLADAYELTARELEITQLLARGLATEGIAAELFLSPHTVRDHIKAVFDKTGVSTRGALVGKLFLEHYEPVAAAGTLRTRP